MIKLIKLFLLLILAVVLLIFCIRIFKPAELEKSTYTVSDCGEAAMTVTGVNGTVIDVSIVYQANAPGMYGEHYTLEIEKNGEWYVLPMRKNAVFFDIGISLEKGRTSRWTTDLNWGYKNLRPGRYRIIKDISVSNQTMNSHRCSLSAEFTLEP